MQKIFKPRSLIRLKVIFATIMVATSAFGDSGRCPFRSEDSGITALWDQTKARLEELSTDDESCNSALRSMTAGLRLNSELLTSDGSVSQNQTSVTSSGLKTEVVVQQSGTGTSTVSQTQVPTGIFQDPLLSVRIELERAEARLIVLTAHPELDPRGLESGALNTRITTLRNQLESSESFNDEVARRGAAGNLLSGVQGALDSLPAVRDACTEANGAVASQAAQGVLNLVSTASPILFGANQTVSAIAGLLGSLINAFTGRSSAERGLDLMEDEEKLGTLACLYFDTQRYQCNLTRSGTPSNLTGRRHLETIRGFYEDSETAPLGQAMRGAFNRLYDRERLGPAYLEALPQYCAILSSVPGNSRMCPRLNEEQVQSLGPANSHCAYMDYYERGMNTAPTGTGFPSNLPGAPLGQPRTSGGAR